METNYYNTTGESHQAVMDFSDQNDTQDARILSVFRANQRHAYGASDFKRIHQNMVLTSIRRALNTLERKGQIAKTGMMQMGLFGRNENLYRYKG